MEDVVTEFAKVLETERQIALRADVDALGAIQEEKRVLLDKLLASGAPEAETENLRKKALANVQLIRHLVACLQGLSTPPGGPTYTAGGGRAAGTLSRSWGRL
jgi:hypothetical protein